ncbi:cytochrome c3 family protein [Altererythrobacter sp. KTW20L]|uniref:cytochrome c3 family protein n=1 Tax=Altererythrobacter sp. KTW20L TaxID=2942210 RepID=UPI0020BE2284|nr:cytochrome c3 family protein [Altererythrobacter sp. KTW20L]MCL6251497.1 cytochrome c3 family protein [Altererythrobacter sp. KTW20L]
MMTMLFRIRTIDFTAAGRELVRNREVSADSLGVGRATSNAVHLPDLAVEQEHLRISATPAGALALVAAGSLGFTIDGRQVMSASVDPARGAELGVGSYRLELARDDDGTTLITVRQVADDEGEGKDRLRGFSLASAMPGKRAMSWIGIAAILIAFLAIPIWTHLNRERVEPDLNAVGAVRMDASWSTGALSSVHHGLEDNCEACHVEPFQPVQDATCLTCHEDIADHALASRMDTGRPAPSGGDALLWRIARTFGKPGPGACTDCHTEHEGAGRMEPTAQAFCSDCHNTLDARLTDTALGNARDFGELHPEFKVAVLPTQGASRAVRVSLDSNPQDWNGLRFPHDVHLDATSGVTQMARRLGEAAGYGEVLQCSNCHTPTADGVRFLPVNMENNCEACHSLVYDQVGTTFRTLRHGNIEQTQADLLAADRAPRRPVTTGRRRPGDFAEGGIYYGNFTRVMPSVLRSSVMSEEGLCGECHLPGNPASGALAVAPVTQRDRFMIHGWFDHKAHRQEDCASCHATDTSGSATDLLLPGIASCRDCHEGEASRTAAVPSGCAMCHSYHPPAGLNTAPARIAGLRP